LRRAGQRWLKLINLRNCTVVTDTNIVMPKADISISKQKRKQKPKRQTNKKTNNNNKKKI